MRFIGIAGCQVEFEVLPGHEAKAQRMIDKPPKGWLIWYGDLTGGGMGIKMSPNPKLSDMEQ